MEAIIDTARAQKQECDENYSNFYFSPFHCISLVTMALLFIH